MQDQRLKIHAALVDDMASAQGIDLAEEALRGHLSLTELEDAVLRCTGCSAPELCAHWLSAKAGVPLAPDYCRNGAFFDDLLRRR